MTHLKCFGLYDCLTQALDPDLDTNVTYRIRTDEARELFAVNPLTGELRVLHSFDFEKLLPNGTTWNFVVEAVDGESGKMPPGLASVTVTVLVRESQLCSSIP